MQNSSGTSRKGSRWAYLVLLILFIALRPSGLLGPRDDLTHNLFPRRS